MCVILSLSKDDAHVQVVNDERLIDSLRDERLKSSKRTGIGAARYGNGNPQAVALVRPG